MKQLPHPRSAFSLVEISIVLVILGLLVGGVLAGQSLIRAAELRAVTTEYSRYATAVMAFRDKYFALPGDMNNAQSFWGVAHATPATCVTTASTDSRTCNGNGNGRISSGATSSNESFRFWQHLANAGLIGGTYTGVADGSTITATTTQNAPSGKISDSLWFIQDMGTQTGQAIWFDGVYENSMQFGGRFTNYDPATPNLKPEEAWNIDTKTDDGKPAQGKQVVRAQSGLSTCTDGTTSTATDANYLLTATGKTCSIIFRNL